MIPNTIRTSALLTTLFAAATLSAAPQLVLSTNSLGPVHVFPGLKGSTQTVEAFNAGTGLLNLTTTVSAPWLAASVQPLTACTTRSGNCNPIGITLNTSTLVAGTYTGYINLTDPNAIDSPQQIAVNINVAGIPATLTEYVTPFGGPKPAAFTPIFTQGAVTGVATTQTGGVWLTFISGGFANIGTPYGIQVAAHNGLAPGNYTGSVVITGVNPADNQTVSVTLTVTNSPILVTGVPSIQFNSFKGGAKPTSSLTFTNVGAGTLAIIGVQATSSTGNFLSAAFSNSSVTVTADPGSLAPGTYTGSVTITSNAANNSQISIPVVFNVETPGVPLITFAGVVNIANYSSDPAAPGEILTIFGDQLAAPGTSAQNPGLPPLATTLGGVQVLVNNVPAPLYYVSPTQVNFQMPYEVPVGSMATVQVVSNSTPGNVRPLNMIASVPRLLNWNSVFSGNYAIAVNQDYSLVLPASLTIGSYISHPAKAGDTITVYCTGLGQTTPAAVTGAAASATTLQPVNNVSVTFGGAFTGTATNVAAYFAGLTPTSVGLYQVNVTLPANTPVGAAVPVTVNISVNGVASNSVNIAVSQ